MKHFLLLPLLFALVIAVPAQTKKPTQQKRAQQTAATRKPVQQKRQAATTATAKKKTAAKQAATSTKQKTAAQRRGKATTQQKVQSPSVKSLQNQRQKLQQQMAAQEKLLKAKELDVKQRLQTLMLLNNEIADKKRTIDTIRRDISTLDGNIHKLNDQLDTLQRQLDDRKLKYMKSMRYMHRNRSIQSQLMFIFSAHNFSQMMRRQRFVREYASYQRAQGEAVKIKQEEVTAKRQELSESKKQKDALLYRGVQEHKSLEGKQTEQQNVVTTLQKEQKTIQNVIAEQKRKDAALNAQIDRLIAEEIARAKAKAEAEAKRKAAEEAAKKRAAELARKKAAAEAARRENERRIAEAKAKEEAAKAAARAAAQKSAKERAAAERKAKEAEQARKAAERKANEEAKVHEREVAEAKKSSEEVFTVTSEARRLSGSFESNCGRLPMPVVGACRIVSHYGQNVVEGLKGVTLDNKGINIKGQAGAQVRSIFDGKVSAVFDVLGVKGVIVTHGRYISVYYNLGSVSVRQGQQVKGCQALGTVGSNSILQFQLRKETVKLNPEKWLGRR